MSDWVETTDKSTGKVYYYNKVTKLTSWTRPAEMDAASSSPAAAAAGVSGAADPENVAANWAQSVDKNTGRAYYYNRVTKKTSWKRPECMGPDTGAPVSAPAAPAAPAAASPTATAAPATATASTPAAASDDWSEAKDPKSGRTYWYNKVTKVTTWKNPREAGSAPTSAPASPALSPAAAPAAAPTAAATDTAPSSASSASTASSVDTADTATAASAAPASSPLSRTGKKLNLDSDDESDGDDGKDSEDDGEESDHQDDKVLDLKKKMSDRDVGEERRKLEEDGEDELFNFEFAKHRKGIFNRILRVGTVFDEDRLLSFKKSLIKKALLKQNREMDAEAVQAFKNVMSYMGDRKSSKKPIDHAKKMLRNLMMAPSGLRDELYMQICKQTTKNPKLESTVKGWELMVFCLAVFPPSKLFKAFLADYIKRNAEDSSKPAVQAFAKVCHERLGTIFLMGQRKQVPSALELECLRELKPIPIRINLVNNSFKTFNVDPYTLVGDVQAMLEQKYNLQVSAPFALYESGGPNIERILDPKDRILDVCAAWENSAVVEEEKGETKKVKDRATGKVVKQEDGTPAPKNTYNSFLFKAKLVLKTTNKDIMHDSEAINLIYVQACSDVVTSRYPANEKDITTLAALQLQATYGDYKKDVHVAGWLEPKLNEVMPQDLLANKKKGSKTPKEWEQLILVKYQKVAGFTPMEAKLNYLDYVQEWTFYGATFFMVEQRQFKDYPSPLTLGINCEGLLLMHPEKRTVLENYGYTDIVTWGHSDEKFIVVVGNIVQQRKLIFKTQDGKAMNHLIHDYVKFKVKDKNKQ